MLPDRALVTMRTHMMASYVDLLIKTCHRRGTFAMGGMAAQIPIRTDAAANKAALDKVRDDKLREVQAGHDGTWVAHPDLIPIAMEIFNKVTRLAPICFSNRFSPHPILCSLDMCSTCLPPIKYT